MIDEGVATTRPDVILLNQWAWPMFHRYWSTHELGLQHKIYITPPELSHTAGYRQLLEPTCCNYVVLVWCCDWGGGVEG